MKLIGRHISSKDHMISCIFFGKMGVCISCPSSFSAICCIFSFFCPYMALDLVDLGLEGLDLVDLDLEVNVEIKNALWIKM